MSKLFDSRKIRYSFRDFYVARKIACRGNRQKMRSASIQEVSAGHKSILHAISLRRIAYARFYTNECCFRSI